MPTPLTFPTLTNNPSSIDWKLRTNTHALVSPFDLSVQTVEKMGARWQCAAAWELLNDADSRKLFAFLASLRGRSGRFYFTPTFAASPLSSITGSPLVNGAGQTGASLVVDGFTGTIKTGDFFHFDTTAGRELKIVTEDRAGPGTLRFEPAIRIPPADNAQLVFSSPSCIMMLDSDDQAGPSVTGSFPYGYSIQMVEAYAT